MNKLASLLGLWVFVMASVSFASTVECQYRTNGNQRGIFKMGLESYYITLTDRFNNPDNDYVYEQGREIVCGESQNVRALNCHHEQNRNGHELQWSIRCNEDVGNYELRALSDARVELDFSQRAGTYTCKSTLNGKSRAYFDLTNCVTK
jgi:hypothetical protein